MSWLSDMSDYIGQGFTPDTMPAWGVLSGVTKSALPQYAPNGQGITGMGPGTALFGILNNIAQGGMEGAKTGQEMTKGGIDNQLSQMTLDWYKARQAARDAASQQQQVPGSLAAGSPMMPGVAAKNAPGGMVGQVPMVGGMPYLPPGLANSMPAFINQQTKMLELNRGLGPDGSVQILPNALNAQGQLEYNKGQAAELGKQTAMTHERPDGPQFGLQGIPGFNGVGSMPAYGGVPGSAPFGFNPASVVSSAIGDIKQDRPQPGMGPGEQAPPEIPQVDASALQMPPQVTSAPLPPPPTPGQMPPQVSSAPPSPGGNSLQNVISSQQGKPDPTGMPRYKYDQNSKYSTDTAGKMRDEDIAENQKYGDLLGNYAQQEMRLNTVADALKVVQSGGLATKKAELANLMQGLGVNPRSVNFDDPKSVYNILHEQGISTLQQLKTMTEGTGSKFTQSEFKRIGDYMNNPDIPPETNLQLLGEAIGTIHYDKQRVADWNNMGGLGNRAANGYTLRPSDFSRKWQLDHNIEDFVKSAKDNIGPLKGMISPNDKHIQALKVNKNNPAAIQQFEQKFGPGSAKKYLGAE